MSATKLVVGCWLLVVSSKKNLSYQNLKSKTQNLVGFTLIELMVSIAIVAIVSAVGVVVYSSAQKSGRISRRVQDLKALQTGLELYKSALGTYPVQSAAGTCANFTTGLATLVPTYMPALPQDPLNNETNCYLYQSNATGTEYKVWTSTDEMSANDYNIQPGMIDPFRDGSGSNCTLEAVAAGTTATTNYAWALYSSNGTAVATNSCGY